MLDIFLFIVTVIWIIKIIKDPAYDGKIKRR